MPELLSLMNLEQIEENLFRASHPVGRTGRLYGGQIMAQATMAAAYTVRDAEPPRILHSLHGYFLRPGDPSVPAIIQVERSRDGQSFSNRRVLVVQHGEPIFSMDLSFHIAEPGFSHFDPMPDLLPPEDDKIPDYLYDSPFITWRFEFRRLQSETPQPPQQFVWFKANGEVPDDPLLQTCLLVYESDNTLLGTTRLPHRGQFEREKMQVASLDHAMWFHQGVDLNQWHLYAQDSPSTSHSRGLSRGSIYTRDGHLVASTVQEGLIRLVN
ncbi:MAG: acyl-CoA thioesterase-2 [Limisphaerales bacterium]|jgi:acyl-CoA thioesterase-2